MKAFVASLLLLVAISACAYYALDRLDMSAADVFQSQSGNVRL